MGLVGNSVHQNRRILFLLVMDQILVGRWEGNFRKIFDHLGGVKVTFPRFDLNYICKLPISQPNFSAKSSARK
ncbi:MAG: hypothetical protein PWP34_2177 [Desulfuromonadales bacterium]|nr:hypothetical protein [Desulfuromonadales bacterium]